MSKLRKIQTAFGLIARNRKHLVHALGYNGFLSWLPTRQYLQLLYYVQVGKPLNLNNPRTFNEKLQWLKLYWRDDTASSCSDKYEVRQYVESKGLGATLNELYGVYSTADEVDFDSLPDRFVLKSANGSNCVIICKDKSRFDKDEARRTMRAWLRKDFYRGYREWVYRNLPPRIVAERYLEDKNGELLDYKIFCFNGEPKLVEVDIDRYGEHKRNLYDLQWNLQPFGIRHPTAPDRKLPKPAMLDAMIEMARVLSAGFPHVRVDVYDVDSTIYFGELTFFHGGGVETFTDERIHEQLGSWLQLPDKALKHV